jgi:RNA polymerase sigma-70 factor (ECF subfamily)
MTMVAPSILISLSDRELVSQYQQSLNEIYFSELHRRYYKKVNAYCLKALRNQTDAADMVQEIFLKAFEKLPTLNHPDLWVAWLFRIARNKIINWHKREALHRMDILDEKAPDIEVTDEIAEKLEIERKLQAIPQLLEKMPVQEAILIRLKYFEGQSINHLCSEMHLKESALKMRLLRARMHIVKMYEEQYRASA